MATIKISVEGLDAIRELQEWVTPARLEAAGEAVMQLADRNAREKIGGGFGGRLADAIRCETSGETVEIFLGGPEGYIGLHVHEGGAIRSRSGKPLAIPLPTASTRRYNPQRLFAREISGQVPLFRLRSRAGNELLFRRPDKGGELEAPLFLLKDETAPQRPRPWWPTEAEALDEVDRFFEENF